MQDCQDTHELRARTAEARAIEFATMGMHDTHELHARIRFRLQVPTGWQRLRDEARAARARCVEGLGSIDELELVTSIVTVVQSVVFLMLSY
jgi:hypothetical protein